MTYHHLSVLVHRQAEKNGDKTALGMNFRKL